MKNENYYTELPTTKEAVIIIFGIIILSLLFQYIAAGFSICEFA